LAQQTQNKVRINAGEWRSRQLRFPEALGLRPTPDRVRQALFNWLGQELHGMTCLDLFAGSGALGFEALSRGADAVVMVEQNSAVHRALMDNARLLKAERAQILREDALQFLARDQQQFDVVFLDPPFGQDWLNRLLPQMAQHLKPTGALYVEAEAELTQSPGWNIHKHGRAGNVHYHLLKLAHAE
jgi:16S rRNA (guanine(966)-N(2))-methyltransferase RsmD